MAFVAGNSYKCDKRKGERHPATPVCIMLVKQQRSNSSFLLPHIQGGLVCLSCRLPSAECFFHALEHGEKRNA